MNVKNQAGFNAQQDQNRVPAVFLPKAGIRRQPRIAIKVVRYIVVRGGSR